MAIIKYGEPEKGLGYCCEGVLRSVPEWFGREEALRNYVSKIDSLDTYTAWADQNLIGFFSVKKHNEYSAELYVLAVRAGYHRQGIGKQLYGRVESDLKAKSVRFIQVKTLGEAAGDQNYEKTRLFYEAQGFYPLEESNEIWGESTPCLVMVKAL